MKTNYLWHRIDQFSAIFFYFCYRKFFFKDFIVTFIKKIHFSKDILSLIVRSEVKFCDQETRTSEVNEQKNHPIVDRYIFIVIFRSISKYRERKRPNWCNINPWPSSDIREKHFIFFGCSVKPKAVLYIAYFKTKILKDMEKFSRIRLKKCMQKLTIAFRKHIYLKQFRSSFKRSKFLWNIYDTAYTRISSIRVQTRPYGYGRISPAIPEQFYNGFRSPCYSGTDVHGRRLFENISTLFTE